MTAAAFAKVLGSERYSITLVESELIGTVGVGEATIPQIILYNKVLGLDEDEFVRETNATFKLGLDFIGWGREGNRYFHPFGLYGVDTNGIAFQHFWMRWKRQGGNLDIWRFNAETEAASHNKFMRTPVSAPQLPTINYAFQFDATLYARYLRRFSEARGVVRVEGQIVTAHQHPETGFVESVELKDGRRIEGDFFVDCSGFRGLLIEQLYKAGYEDWSKWLPNDRAAAMPCAKVEPPHPYTRLTAREAGWQWRIPLQHRTGNGYVFSSNFISEDEAATLLSQRLDAPALADPKVLRFTGGKRRKVWIKNVVANGLASGFLEPLESTSIHLVQVTIAKLLTYFPKNGFVDAVIDRFNNDMVFEYESVRDFLIAHYKVTDREDTPFWRYCKNMDVPDSLAARLESFKARGEVTATLSELFKDTNWFAILYGQGMVPDDYHPVADVMPEKELRLLLSNVRTGIQERVRGMPTHQAFIDQNCSAETRRVA
jgi:tryptophan halogenase